MTVFVDTNPDGRHGRVLTHDLPPTPEQRALQEAIDKLGQVAVERMNTDLLDTPKAA